MPPVRLDIQGGMSTAQTPDLLPPGRFSYLQNVRRILSGRTVARAPLGANLLGGTISGAGGITSTMRMNDGTPGFPSFVRILGAAGKMYVNTTLVVQSMSGAPLSFLVYRPNASPQPWCYVADNSLTAQIENPLYPNTTSGMVKVRSDGTTYKQGIAEPQTAPTVTFPGGGSGVTQIFYRYVYRSSITGALSNPSPESIAGTNALTQVSATVNATDYPTKITLNATQYELNSGQLRTKGGVAPGTVTDYIIEHNNGLGVPDGTQVAQVTSTGGSGMTPGTYPLIFSGGGSPTTPATGTVTVTASTVTNITITNQGEGYSSPPSVTAATGGTPPTFTAILTTPATITGVQIDLNWLGQNAGTGVLTAVSLFYLGNRIGTAKFPGIANQSFATDTLQGGNSDGWGASLTPAIVNDPSFGFGVQITTQAVGGTDRSFINFFTITIFYSIQNSTVTPVASTDPQVNKIDFYRQGGALPEFTYVGTGPNTSTAFVDTLSDLAAEANPLLEFDNFEPFPSIDLPQAGVVNVAAGAVAGTMAVTWVSGNTFNVRWLPGTDIIIGGIAYTFYNRPTDTTHLTVILETGQVVPPTTSNLTYEIAEPDLAAEPSPVEWGPTPENAGNFAFALDPLNPGDLVWTKGTNFDSAPQGNRLNVTSPNEPLMNGTVTAELSTVFSTERFWLIYPNFADAVASVEGVAGQQWTLIQSSSTRGLYMRYAIAALGAMTVFRAKDGIFVSMNGGEEQPITNDIFNLFPHGNIPGKSVVIGGQTVFAPDDTNPNAQTIAIIPGYVFYNYQDVNGNPRTLVYDQEGKGWSVDAYTPTVNYHSWDVGPNANQVVEACSDGTIRTMSPAGTESQTAIMQTRSENAGNTRVVKRLGGFFLRAVASTAITLAFYAQRFQTAITGFSPGSVTGSSGVEQDFLVDFTRATNADVLDWGAVLSWAIGGSSPNVLSEYDVDTTGIPQAIIGYKTAGLTYGRKGWMHIPWMNLSYKSTATVTVVLTFDNGSPITLTFPSTSGAQAKTFQTLTFNKFKLVSWTVNSSAPFTLFADECEILLAEWGGSSEKISPFAGFGIPGATN